MVDYTAPLAPPTGTRPLKNLQTLFGKMFCVLFILPLILARPSSATERPNVILIMCDDLNDYVEGFDGHPQTHTPNMHRLAKRGVSFTQAHCNIPICGPSRACMFTGIYPHNSGCYGFTRWDEYEVLRNSRTIMDHFRANGYYALGTGKLMHHMVRKEWDEYGNQSDYGPFPMEGDEKIAHPDVPMPFREIGPIDGSFGPLIDFGKRKSPTGNTYHWQTGSWGKLRELRVGADGDIGKTADELNGDWAVKRINQLSENSNGKPFFLGVGFIRPHTPLIVPKRFFDMFPLEEIQLPTMKAGDVDDTHARSIRGIPAGADGPRSEDMGTRLFSTLVKSYASQDLALRKFIQAYLASVASVDEQIGKILDAINESGLDKNTVIVLTSDHGWGMGEKDYLYKNSLWQESTRVPLIICAPGVGKAGHISDQPVSLIDVYPTLIDLCSLSSETKKSPKGHSLDGHSMRPLLENPASGSWTGPDEALTALYKWGRIYKPSEQSYSLRAKNWRYIRYANGKEELYDTAKDYHEWTNLADTPSQHDRLLSFRRKLAGRLPAPETTGISPKSTKPAVKRDAEYWKNRHFAKHPDADTNGDGKLSWPEFHAHKKQLEATKQK